MKRILLVLALLVTGTLLGAPQAAAAELAVNGGFESGSLSPWSCTGNLGSVVTSPVHSGTRALAGAASSSDNAKCTQNINGLVSGTSYTLSGWFNGAYTYLGLTGGASTWRNSSTWGQLSLTFTASGTSAQIYFHGWYGQGTYYADDISLQGQGGGGGTVPGAPGGLAVTGSTSSSISLSWSASSGTVTGYRVYEGTTQRAQVTGTSTTISGLTCGTSHTYVVRAYNTNGESPNSNSATGSTTGCTGTVPGVPPNLQVTGTSNTSISLSWGASSGTVTGYRVYEGTTQRAQVTGTSTTISGLAACTSHTYTVRAYNTNGESGGSNQASGSTTGCTGGGSRLMGYFVQWGVYGRNYHVKNIHTSGSAAKLTHINYAFGNVTNGQCSIGDAYADYDKFYDAASSVDGVSDTWDAGALRGNFGQLKRLKKMYPHLKVLFSFGGWTWSGGFPQAVSNPTAFANSCYNLVNDPRWAGVFDGIDLDWEYPNACGLSCDTTTGFSGFRNMMQAMRSRFGSQLVTAAITADGTSGGKIDAADYGGAAQYVDWYNVMTYDFFGTWAATGPTAPHSPLNCYAGIPIQGFCAETAIAKLKSKGIPSSKLLLGIGFYGRGWTGVTQSAPGGSATGAAPGTYEAGNEDYKVISSRCPPTGTVGGTSYAFCGNQWWSYDTPGTIGGKMSYTRGQALGGAFFWELSGDTTGGSLVTAMKNGL